MGSKFKLPKFPRVNWKLIIAVILIILLVVLVVKCVPRFLSGGEQTVGYEIVDTNETPEKLEQIIPRYKMLERALATKVDESVYVIVTRGEKLTGGYTVDIEKMTIVKEKEEDKLVVYAVFKDPKPEELVPQVITYPYIVLKTDLKELPQKIDLQVKYLE
ncbi:protease complex subunit PrcB family protein [Alkaliphilus crotonatoxidans]